MPGTEMSDDKLEDDILAFEYVSGSLAGAERQAFQQRLNTDDHLKRLVYQWEEQLVVLQSSIQGLEPKPSTWQHIENAISPTKATSSPTFQPTDKQDLYSKPGWLSGLLWAFSGALASLLFVVLLFKPLSQQWQAPATVDYVAVMTSAGGQQALTTLGSVETGIIQLNWGDQSLAVDEDYQLWAVSKRDGEIRSLAIIDNSDTDKLILDDAHWRLIMDAESLLLTREDAGGSAIDEPSDRVVATGICVRIQPRQVSS